jgi:hypothetical protein
MTYRKLSDLFTDEPTRWGLRGDPHLWRDMKQALSDVPYPATEDQATTLIVDLFNQLTGAPISSKEAFFVQKYAHGGMSSGYISPEFWRETALPLLRFRYAQTKDRVREYRTNV